MNGAIEVRTAPRYWGRVGCLGALFGALALVLAWRGVAAIVDSDSSAGAIAMPLGAALVALLAPLWFVFGRLSWVSRFDAQGVTLQSGRRFAWNELQRVRAVHGRVGQVIYHELTFRSGRGRIFPAMLANPSEVLPIVATLERGQLPFAPPQR